ncbi:MAG TPA: hypothetical protein VGW33_12525 [Terriglobia bacterium]|nr:hypothetical protein [Terriglobia bacterium]
MICPICQKRKASRFCPAKAESICSVCCATEREVTIDCPSDCDYLIASRQREGGRRVIDWSKIPFADVKIPPEAMAGHWPLISALVWVIARFAQDNRPLVDTDAIASVTALAETYRTLSSGLYYEKPPDYRLQRELYEALKVGIEDYKKAEAQEMGATRLGDGTVRDALIFLAQIGSTRQNGRPKGRAYLDFLRAQSKLTATESSAPGLVLP